MTRESAPEKSVSTTRLVALAWITGLLGFGGGWAVLARMRQRVVDERGWMTAEDFVQCTAVASALPGATAPNLFSIVGFKLAGVRGALAATVAFILPSAIIMVLLGAAYDRVRGIETVRVIFLGMNPAVAGVVAAVAVELYPDALRAARDWIVAALAAIALVTRALTLLEVVVLAGIVGVLSTQRSPRPPPMAGVAPFASTLPLAGSLFVVFAKIGVATFGGGLAMIPAIAREAIGRGWVDEQGFADAIALGQITPGPVAISATFIGYRAAGLIGALAATLGMLLPPFIVCVVAARSLRLFRASHVVRGLLGGIAPAVVGIVAAASYSLGRACVSSPLGVAILVGAFAVRVGFPRTTPLLPIFMGAVAALVLTRFGVH